MRMILRLEHHLPTEAHWCVCGKVFPTFTAGFSLQERVWGAEHPHKLLAICGTRFAHFSLIGLDHMFADFLSTGSRLRYCLADWISFPQVCGWLNTVFSYVVVDWTERARRVRRFGSRFSDVSCDGPSFRWCVAAQTTFRRIWGNHPTLRILHICILGTTV